MKTIVQFRSKKFPPYEQEEDLINTGLWGKRLAEYLVQRLAEKGVGIDEIIAEDWGWYVPVRVRGTKLALCCGHQRGEVDEFICFTDPSTPIVQRLFRKVDVTAPLALLIEVLDQILRSDPEISDISWSDQG